MTLDGQICHVSTGAHALLMLCDGLREGGASRDRLSRPPHELARGVLPTLLLTMHGSRLPVSADPSPLAVWLVHDTLTGPLHATALLLSPLHPTAASFVQVMLRRLEPRRLVVGRALRSLPLTTGQLAVCRELHHGGSRTAVAARPGVSPTTVVDPARKIHDALGVRSALYLWALPDSRLLG